MGEVNYGRKSSEQANVKFRRSLYFVKDLKAGDVITPDADEACDRDLDWHQSFNLGSSACALRKMLPRTRRSYPGFYTEPLGSLTTQ